VATQEAFKDNADISGEIGKLVEEIATASQEQAHGIAQVNTAVSEMDRVTQETAASAEESASAAEEMNAQAQQMRSYVEELAAVIGGNAAARESAASAPPLSTGMVDRHKVFPHHRRAADVRKAGKAPRKLAGVRPAALIPFGDDEKGNFKDF
jgi:methyl-accepting chemotaxis protein